MENQEGYALVPTIVILAVLIIVLYTMTSLVANEIGFVVLDRNNKQTFYTAEAGLEYANTLLNDETKWDDDNLIKDDRDTISGFNPNVTLESLTKQESGNIVTLESTAVHNNGAQSIITVQYDKETIISNVFDYSLVADGDIELKNKVKVYGIDNDIDNDGIPYYEDSNIQYDLDGDGTAEDYNENFDLDDDDIPLKEDSFIDIDGDGIAEFRDYEDDSYGDIYTTGLVTEKNDTEIINAVVKDEQTENIIPEIYDQIYNQIVDSQGNLRDSITTENGTTTISSNYIDLKNGDNYEFDNNIVYLDQSVSFPHGVNLTGEGILIVNGDITFKNSVFNEEDQDLLIISNGNVYFKNSSYFNGMVYAEEKITINAKVDIFGTAISRSQIEDTTISVANGGSDPSAVIYDRSYLEIFDKLGVVPPYNNTTLGYELTIKSWVEN